MKLGVKLGKILRFAPPPYFSLVISIILFSEYGFAQDNRCDREGHVVIGSRLGWKCQRVI